MRFVSRSEAMKSIARKRGRIYTRRCGGERECFDARVYRKFLNCEERKSSGRN